jgi:hypothetical protein
MKPYNEKDLKHAIELMLKTKTLKKHDNSN